MKNGKDKLLVKDVTEFVREHEVLYATGISKRLYIKLHAAPSINRYTVIAGAEEKGFIKVGDAVKYYNSLGD
jgi:hypothetical protein